MPWIGKEQCLGTSKNVTLEIRCVTGHLQPYDGTEGSRTFISYPNNKRVGLTTATMDCKDDRTAALTYTTTP